MCMNEHSRYITLEELANTSNKSVATIKRRLKDIPGIVTTDRGIQALSGTRYPYDGRSCRVKDYGGKIYTLLKAISLYRYISSSSLRIEQRQFEDMLKDLLAAGLIQRNNLCNSYGANAYDCTLQGQAMLDHQESEAKTELLRMVATVAGTYTGAVISQLFDAA